MIKWGSQCHADYKLRGKLSRFSKWHKKHNTDYYKFVQKLRAA